MSVQFRIRIDCPQCPYTRTYNAAYYRRAILPRYTITCPRCGVEIRV